MNTRKDVISAGRDLAEPQAGSASHSEVSNEISNRILQEAVQQRYEEPQSPSALYDSLALLLRFVEESARQFKSDKTKRPE